MTYQHPNRPPRPETDPLPPESAHRDTDRVANAGYILAVLGTLLVVFVLIMWAGPTDQETASNPPATTGQGGQVPPQR